MSRRPYSEAAQDNRPAPLAFQDSNVLRGFNSLFISQAITTTPYKKLAGV